MTLMLFKYGLPLLLGYTLFVGIAGRFNPLALPFYREERPSWYLGIWTGLAVSFSLIVGLRMAYILPSSQGPLLLQPTAMILAALLIPAFGAYAYFQLRPIRNIKTQTQSNFEQVLSEVNSQETSEADAEIVPNQPRLDAVISTTSQQRPMSTIPMTDVRPAYLKTVHTGPLAHDATTTAINDDKREHDASETHFANTPVRRDTPAIQALAKASHEQYSSLRHTLGEEINLRKQTEHHLRITRKALSILESNTRDQPIVDADVVLELESKLAKCDERIARLKARALREKAIRKCSEQNVDALKQKIIKAKQDIRRSTAARAKALSTANKSIAFARQTIQIRTRLESELAASRSTINSRQKTISSLVKALEREKRKTRSEVTIMAKQMLLHERQLNARRSLEEVARNVENKLTSRLVKKVAKAKPLLPDVNQGKAS